MKVIGSFVSPYVRKVLAVMELKGIDYEVDPITPFFGNDEFERLSPLRRIPVLIDGDLVLSDSSVICAYLEDVQPNPATLPADIAARARARWFEEYADTRLGDVFIWGLFYPRFVHPMVWGEPCDQARIDHSLAVEIPRELDYLERELPSAGWICGDYGLADIAVASFFRNAAYAGFTVDAARWPTVHAFVESALAHPVMEKLGGYEKIQLSTTISGRRQALIDAGVRLTANTMAQRTPAKGVMRL
ncbi:glutathione S-transferase family protein [Sphingomonas jaspsi]|uniref:glutathione S-transferase family protein n=1 Tax=Sphingomonas jaspsi TaxID=392409 RepID=UPI0004B1BD85|nr:glutathione S-transferase family protein [Sphingomonas jaspsi]